MIPTRTSYSGQSYKLFEDYNDIHVFVEDSDFENLYETIFKRCGSNINKVFSKNGKISILDTAASCNDHKCIYLLDRDWDDILGNIPNLKNVVVLDRHSIENYLINYEGFKSIVMCEFPKTDIRLILSEADLQQIIHVTSDKLRPLFECFVALQMCEVKKKGCSIDPGHFQERNCTCAPDVAEIAKFISDSAVETPQSVISYFSDNDLLAKGHGKYMLHYVWEGVRHKTRISKIAIDKLMLRLAYTIETSDIQTIVDNITHKATLNRSN